MSAEDYNNALRVITVQAIKANISLPQILGALELAKLETHRMITDRAQAQAAQVQIVPGIINLPRNGKHP